YHPKSGPEGSLFPGYGLPYNAQYRAPSHRATYPLNGNFCRDFLNRPDARGKIRPSLSRNWPNCPASQKDHEIRAMAFRIYPVRISLSGEYSFLKSFNSKIAIKLPLLPLSEPFQVGLYRIFHSHIECFGNQSMSNGHFQQSRNSISKVFNIVEA